MSFFRNFLLTSSISPLSATLLSKNHGKLIRFDDIGPKFKILGMLLPLYICIHY